MNEIQSGHVLKIQSIRKALKLSLATASLVGLVLAAAQLSAQMDTFGISVESSPQIFATMSALDAAGFDANADTSSDLPAWIALRGDLLQVQGPATDALRQFYRDHALANPSDTLSRYITFALVAGAPPSFDVDADSQFLPPDVLSIDGFQSVLAAFYREARLDLRWARLQSDYELFIGRYRPIMRQIVTTTDAYLREVERPSTGRSFALYVEPLVGPRTNFRNLGDKYAIVVGTGAESHVDAIQHAFLHFKLDPLVLRYRPALDSKTAILNAAGRAPRLPDEYRSDFVSFTDECVVKAVELRLRHLSPDGLESALKQEDQSGFILVRTFVAQLQKFEKDEPAMSYYFPNLITAISVDDAKKQFANFAFAPADSASAPDERGAAAAQDKPVSELDRWLAEGDHDIARKDAPAATAAFQTVLAKYPDEPRGLYGLAIASVLSGKASQARGLFEKVISLQNSAVQNSQGSAHTIDPGILAWSHVYLGRIHDLEDERDLAVNEYRAALAVDGAPEAARAAAQSGAETAYTAPARSKSDP